MANIKRNLAYNLVLSVSQLMLPLLSIPYISRVLDPSGIGHVGFIDSFTYYFVIIAEFGITTYGIREIARAKDDPDKIRLLVPQLLTVHVISSLIVLVFYVSGIALLWNKIGDVRLVFFSLAFFLVNFFACEWYFMGREDFGYIAGRSILVRVAGLISIFLLIRQPDDYYLYYAVIVGSAVLTSLWNNIVLFRQVRFSFRKVAWKQHLRFVWVTYLISLFYSLPLLLDNVVLGLVSSAAIVGIYSFSVKVVRIGSTVLTDSFFVFFPRIVALSSQLKLEQLQQKLSLNLQFIVLLSVPMGVGLFLIADDLAAVFFGNKFIAAGDNLRILCLYPFIKGVSLFLSNPVLIAHDQERIYLKNLAISSALFLLSALIFGSLYSSAGACFALIFSEAVLLLLNFLSVSRKLPHIRVNFDFIGHALTGAVIFVPVILVIRHVISNVPVRLFVAVFLCSLLYFSALVFLNNRFVNQLLLIIRRPLSSYKKGGNE